MNSRIKNNWIITRRHFLRLSSATVAGFAVDPLYAFSRKKHPGSRVKFGIVTDSHYADTAPRGSRYFRDSLFKMEECVELMNQMKVDFLIELGDFKDQDTPPNEKNTLLYLESIERVFQHFNGPRYHVLGNHDLDSLSKEEFLKAVDNTGIPLHSRYYAFDLKDMHFIVLDANFKSDGSDYKNGNFKWHDTNIPTDQIDWLKADLKSTNKPVIAFVHQQLDCEGDLCVNNAGEVRKVLEQSGKTLAVFQGHNHRGHYSNLEGIHYYTLKAMVEGTGRNNNAYAIVAVYDNGSISINGYRKAISKELA
jgi:predicted phosphodiesterase